MEDILVKVKKLVSDAKLPCFANEYAVGADLYSITDYKLLPGETKGIKTGIAIELPEEYEAQVRSRSGFALNKSLFVLNSPGTIDPDYRGEIVVILHNAGYNIVKIRKHERVAQLVIKRRYKVRFELVDELSNTERSDKGFGSTGSF